MKSREQTNQRHEPPMTTVRPANQRAPRTSVFGFTRRRDSREPPFLDSQCARRSNARRSNARRSFYRPHFRLEKSTAKPGERRVSGRAWIELMDLWHDQITISERDPTPRKNRRGRAPTCIRSRGTQGDLASVVAKQNQRGAQRRARGWRSQPNKTNARPLRSRRVCRCGRARRRARSSAPGSPCRTGTWSRARSG